MSHCCAFCGKEFPTRGGIKRHIANWPKWRRAWELTIEEKDSEDNAPSMENYDAGNSFSPLRHSRSNSFDCFEADEHNPPTPKSWHVMVEDVADKGEVVDEGEVVGGSGCYFKQCSDGGWALQEGETEFERYQKYKEGMGEDEWAPFCDEYIPYHVYSLCLTLAAREEWGLTEWLVKSLGQTRTNEFLKLPIVSLASSTEKCTDQCDRHETKCNLHSTTTNHSSRRLMNSHMEPPGAVRRLAFREIEQMKKANHCMKMLNCGCAIP